MALAEKMSALIKPSNKKPIYVDCNAVSPPTKVEIGEVVAQVGRAVRRWRHHRLAAEGGLQPGAACLRSRRRTRSRALNEFGIKVNVIEGPVGAASALKMSYAGITKGVTAVASMMMLAATRAGVADKLRVELERSYPAYLASFQRAVPDMFDKAYRFVGEMEEISDFVSEDGAAQDVYQAIAEFYTRIAADHEGQHEETGALAAFLKKKD